MIGYNVTMAIKLVESVQSIASQEGADGIFEVRLINTGWGSSGYYSEELLREYGPKTFVKNTPMYDSHPDDGDPTRRKTGEIVAKLLEDAYYRDGALYTKIKVISTWIERVQLFAESMGLSIFASGEGVEGEINGRKGLIVEAFNTEDPFTSVDFVSAAGRGGKVLYVSESAKFEEATANTRRDELYALVGERYPNEYAYVLDFDEKTVWFEKDQQTYQIGYSVVGDTANELIGEPIKVVRKVTFVPETGVQEDFLDNRQVKEHTMEIEEALKKLQEQLDSIQGLLAPASPAPDAIDRAEVVEKAVAEGLTKTARALVLNDVEAGVPLEEAIARQKALKEEYLEEIKTLAEAEDAAGGRLIESKGDNEAQERFDALVF